MKTITTQLQNLFRNLGRKLHRLFKRRKITRPQNRNATLFTNEYIDLKVWYRTEYHEIPCISYIDDVDNVKALEWVNQTFAGKIVSRYQQKWYDWEEQKQVCSRAVFQLKGKMVIQIRYDAVEILHSRNDVERCHQLIESLAEMKAPSKETDNEINIISINAGRLDLKTLKIKSQPLDIGLYYNDDFGPVDERIKKRLDKENDKGIVLLYGLPGTGKTTYLRHLIGSLDKRILFVSPGVATNLMNPEFMDLLIDHPNCVVIIEDAENIIMDRKYNTDSSVSNLLNISDGLLSDCLNVQIICTFNSALSTVDSALLRKGRLIAAYEFGKLAVSKAQQLSDHLGFQQTITRPMTIAEITCQQEVETKINRVEVVGFRRPEPLMN